MDVVLALTAILILAPLLIAICLLIKFQDGGPILFTQERVGRGGRTFRCWKFRSMRPDAETYLTQLLASDSSLMGQWRHTRKLKRDPRVTRVGEALRRSSLDELPQLINILRGEMSVVGPRPIVAAEIVHYGRWYGYYKNMNPGLTGLWQVSGRNDVSYRRRVALDRLFHRRRSWWLCSRIVAATVPAMVTRKGAY